MSVRLWTERCLGRMGLTDALRRSGESVKTRVFVTLKPSVFDPQGKTIVDALGSMGYEAVCDVRQGKYFELDVATDSVSEALAVSTEVADKLLANPVIESYRVEIGTGREGSE